MIAIYSPFTVENDNDYDNNNNKTPKFIEKSYESESKETARRREQKKKKLPAILIQQHKYELKFLRTQTNYISVYDSCAPSDRRKKTILTHLICD